LETFWLNFVNIALGLATLLCLLAVLGGVGAEFAGWLRRTRATEDDHALSTPELGLTMADGGERLAREADSGRPKTKA
jgi:hypothetical protein